MFTLLSPAGSLALRLPAGERAKFIEKYGTSIFEAYGHTMKEYVTVPDRLLQKTRELKRYLDLSYRYVATLKPKPTKKKHR